MGEPPGPSETMAQDASVVSKVYRRGRGVFQLNLVTGGQPVRHRRFERVNNMLAASLACIVFDRIREVKSLQC